jgi:hypothetical protein
VRFSAPMQENAPLRGSRRNEALVGPTRPNRPLPNRIDDPPFSAMIRSMFAAATIIRPIIMTTENRG